jgi:hypothetical protein
MLVFGFPYDLLRRYIQYPQSIAEAAVRQQRYRRPAVRFSLRRMATLPGRS